MAAQVVLGQVDEVLRSRWSLAGEDLGIDVATDLLNTNFVEARFGRDRQGRATKVGRRGRRWVVIVRYVRGVIASRWVRRALLDDSAEAQE